jgi:hypothetical protein
MSDFCVEYSESNLAKVADLYFKNGFVLVENVFSVDETVEMKKEMDVIIADLNLESSPKSVFSTEDENKVLQVYLLTIKFLAYV